ncbi:MAG: cell division protein FtsZ [Methylocella sp.]
MTINLKAPELRELKPHIMVAGIGGAGGNAVNNMIVSGLIGVEFIVANTDAQALTSSKAERIIQMGLQVTEGLGAGSQPEVGRAAAEEAIEEIRDHLSGAHMVFVTAGMGGGTGTGAAPVIARAARDMGILTVGVVTKPFQFEGARRMRVAEAGIDELQKSVDTLIIIPNQNLFRIANEKTTFADAFAMADQVLYSGVACVTDLMVKEGLINLDFADVRAIMREMGKAMMGTGEASGEKRAILAAEAAIANPLLDEVSMKGSRGLLISITGGSDLTLYEVDEAAGRIRQEVDEDANIILGATFDQSLDGIVRVSVVATGIDHVARVYEPTAAEARIAEVTNRLRAQTAARPIETAQPRYPGAPPEAHPPAEYAPRYEDRVLQASAAPGAGAQQGVRVQEVAPQSRHYVEQAQQGMRPSEHFDADPFVPGPPDSPYVRPQRMPQIDDLPLPAQNQIRARRGERGAEPHPEAKRRSLLERLASFGISRQEEAATGSGPRDRQAPARQPAQAQIHPQQQPSPVHAEYGKRAQHPPAPQRAPQPAVDAHGRGAYQTRAIEEDQLEIPAFLRRQSS